MTAEQIEAMAASARKRMADFVARMAAQQLRRMREKWSKTA